MEKKKPYMKPEIHKVELTPDEAILANCKTAAGNNMFMGRCRSKATCANCSVGS